MTRREFLIAASALPLAAAPISQLSVEGYIFQQYAEARHKPLADVLDEVIPMARSAGFSKIELNPSFFAPDTRKKALELLRANHFAMPSVYVGGPMHEKTGADDTIQRAIKIGQLCAPFGCKAIVNNPDPKRDQSEKIDAELAVEAESLNRMGRTLAQHGFQLRVHHHTPQLVNHAREWRYLLAHTDPQYVFICVDVDWAYEGGFDPVNFLQEVGARQREIHVRSARNKIWLEDVEDSDIDYHQVAAYLKQADLNPLIVVELAYRPATVITRPLQQDLLLSRQYTEKVFRHALSRLSRGRSTLKYAERGQYTQSPIPQRRLFSIRSLALLLPPPGSRFSLPPAALLQPFSKTRMTEYSPRRLASCNRDPNGSSPMLISRTVCQRSQSNC